ncbi:MAG: SAM-dependent methyltransferase [Actinomycetota bacterium]|nr:SAM-dependent methyltransferase [Actinomycetota bacterium]
MFGAVLARWMDGIWEVLGQPDGFTVIEAGAGRGTLARAVIAAKPRCLETGTYLMVERSAVLRADHPVGVGLASSVHLPQEEIPGVLIANELLDNLGFGLLAADGTKWREVQVGFDSGRLVEVLAGERSPPAAISPDAGVRIPVQEEASAWVQAALAVLNPGVMLAIDYTSTTAEMAVRPINEWLRTYRSHERGVSPIDDPGGQDITVEVAVDQLPNPTRTSDQAAFLLAHGIEDLVSQGKQTWLERASIGDLEAVRARSRITEAEALCDPSGLGGFTSLEWRVGY